MRMELEEGSLAELNVNEGDVVDWINNGNTRHTITFAEVITDGSFVGEIQATLSDYHTGIYGDFERFRIVSRASVKPEKSVVKLWRDMTELEQLRIKVAFHEGKVIEKFGFDQWHKCDNPSWHDLGEYRIRPEYTYETANIGVFCAKGFGAEADIDGSWPPTHRINIEMVNGEPDCEKCPKCGTSKNVDIEKL